MRIPAFVGRERVRVHHGGAVILAGAFNNREIASAIWLTMLAVFISTRSDLRQSVLAVASAFLTVKVFLPIAGLLIVSLSTVWIAAQLGAWDVSFAKTASYWYFGTGLGLITNTVTRPPQERSVSRDIISTFLVALAIDFLVNRWVFSLPTELCLVPVLVGGLATVARGKQEHRSVEILARLAVAAVVGAIVVRAVSGLIIDWQRVNVSRELQELAVPVWLTLAVWPFVYAFALYAAYEVAFLRVRIFSTEPRHTRNAELALILTIGPRLEHIKALNGAWIRSIPNGSFKESRQRVLEYLQARRAASQARKSR